MKFFLIYRNAQILKNKKKKALWKVSKVKKKSRENYQNLSKKRKKTQQYGCERHKNLPEDEKQTLVEYRQIKTDWYFCLATVS